MVPYRAGALGRGFYGGERNKPVLQGQAAKYESSRPGWEKAGHARTMQAASPSLRLPSEPRAWDIGRPLDARVRIGVVRPPRQVLLLGATPQTVKAKGCADARSSTRIEGGKLTSQDPDGAFSCSAS